jgi:hypothetical protein
MIHDDPAIIAIREARHRISVTHQHNPRLLIAYYRQLQESYSERLLPVIEPVNGHSGVVTYLVPEMVNHVLAENMPDSFGATQESAETD